MCIVEGYFSCRRDLDIHVHFGSEKAGSKKIHSSDARHLEDLTAHQFFGFCITGVIYHLVNSIPENIDRSFGDHKADHDTGNRIQDGVSQSCSEDTHKGSDRGKCIRAVMPCICHQCSGIDLLRSTSCVPEHPLFCHDGYHCRDQRKGSRDGDAKTCYKQHPRKNNGRNALHSLMSVLMLLVRFFCRKTDTDDNNKSTSHIGCRMDRIRNHRSGMRRNTGDKFKYG